jgi:hypothetical protein
MKSTTSQIRSLQAKQPKITNGGMPARNTPTNAGVMAGLSSRNDGSVNVKSTVSKVLSKIK